MKALRFPQENPVSITGKGTDVDITMVLTNLSNNMTAVLGKYNMNFEEGTFSTISEDIDGAFATVDGLYVPPTDPPYVPPQDSQPDPAPQTEAPKPEESNSDQGLDNGNEG